MLFLPLVALLLSAEPDAHTTVSQVPCKTVAECWLDSEGKPIARPAKFKGRKLPAGNCEANKRWLRNRLSCDVEKKVCVAELVGDKC